MRVGTWNLEGRWSQDHLALLAAQECDVWLLTEVRDDTSLPGFESHLTTAKMSERKHWAAVFSRSQIQPLPDPHPASAAAVGMGLVSCSSILPWRTCGTVPWGEGTTTEKTSRALEQLMAALPVGGLVWGGDWNHAMEGSEYAGSLGGRAAIKNVLADRHLQLATNGLPHCIPGLFTIDHLAVPKSAQIVDVTRIVAEDLRGDRLSDHDAYAAEIALT
ncbi:hypothetical protein PCC79_17135 [Propioniciclava soli]|uniref:Endonuclease/exonuclease/phosphatase family protein n=1 Tax=Propioniciclava soli TaxID=2775081 RepID=A0ABZ3C7R6_9ACTN